MKANVRDELEAPKIFDRSTFKSELNAWRTREKARPPIIEVDGAARKTSLAYNPDPVSAAA